MKRLICFELQKICERRLTQAALAGVLLLSFLLSFSTYQNKYAFDGNGHEGSGGTAVKIDQEIAERYEGILTDEKVQQMMSDFAPVNDLHGMNAAYLYQNAMQSAAFSRFSDPEGNWNGLRVSDVFGGEEIRIGYVDGWLSTSQNMVKIILALTLVTAVMTAPVFCGEYGGMDQILLASRYGRTKCAEAKVIAAGITALTTAAAVLAVNYLFALALYGRQGLDCSILFAPMDYTEGYIPFNITCGALLKYQALLAFTGAVSVTGMTLILSALCKNQIAAFVSSAAVYLLPSLLSVSERSPLFRIVGLLPLYHAQFVSLMSVEQVSGGALYALWAVPAAGLFAGLGWTVSRRIFAKRQVS